MLPRFQRLTRNRIEYLFKKGKRKSNELYTLQFLQNSKSFSRLCMVVSAKTEPKSVQRNLVRRRISEAFHFHQHLLKDHFDLLIIVKKPLLKLEFKDISEVITKLIQSLPANHFHTHLK